MIPTSLPLPQSPSVRGDQHGLAEQWHAMMFHVEDVGSSNYDQEGTTVSSLTNTTRGYQHPEEERQLQSEYNIHRYDNFSDTHRKPKSERSEDRNAQRRELPDHFQSKVYKNQSNSYSSRKPQQADWHPRQQNSLRRQNDVHPLRATRGGTRGGNNYSKIHNNGYSRNKTKSDFLDGIIENLSNLSNNNDGKSKSIMENSKNGWSIHESQRRSQERESRKLAGTFGTNTNTNINNWKKREDNTYDQRGRNLNSQIPNNNGMRIDMSGGYIRRESPHKVERRENPPSMSKFGAYYSDQNRTRRYDLNVDVATRETNLGRNQRSQSLSLDKSLLDDQMSPESYLSPERKTISHKSATIDGIESSLAQPRPPLRTPETVRSMPNRSPNRISHETDKYAATGPRLLKKKRSILKEQNSPPPYLSPKNFVPKNCGPVNGESPLNAVVDLFDAPMRMHIRQSPQHPTRDRSHQRSGLEKQNHNPNNVIPLARQNNEIPRQRSEHSQGSKDTWSEFSLQGTENTPGSSLQPSALHSKSTNSKLPKTEAQKRYELQMLRGIYKDSLEEKNYRPGSMDSQRMSFDQSRNSNKDSTYSIDGQSVPGGSRQPTLKSENDHETAAEFTIHQAIWGSNSSDSKGTSAQSRPPNRDVRISVTSNPPTQAIVATNISTPNLGSLAKSVMMSPSPLSTISKAKVDDFLKSQFPSCNGEGIDSPPKISKLFTQTPSKEMADGKEKDAVQSSSLNMFEAIQQQLLGRTPIDSSGFPTKNPDDNEVTEQEHRIQEKLDAVRDRSIRNAQIFEKMTSENKSQNIQENHFSFACVQDDNTDVFDNITNVGDGTDGDVQTTSSNSTNLKLTSSSGLVTEATIGTNETDVKGYMYVAYSQFGDDARKVVKLCGHDSLPVPNRKKGEVLIRIHASTVSDSDCAIRRGEWPKISIDPYIIPGTALVGRVMENGKKKTRTRSSFLSSSIEAGDIVLSLSTFGANARFTCLPKSSLIKVPSKLNPERVVCLAETYLAAFQSLHLGQKGGIRYRENSLQGKSILIMGGYSPFGKAIIELCRAGGASLCYALISDDPKTQNSSSSRNLRHQYNCLEEWGAVPLSNNPQDWLTLIGRQIDIFVTTYDPNQHAKGMNNITTDHWKALKKDGEVHVVCSHPGMNEADQRNMVFGSSSTNKSNDMKGFRVPSCRPGGREKLADRAHYYNLFDSWEGDRGARAMGKKDLEHLIKLLEIDLLHPEIAGRFPLSKIAKAQHNLQLGKLAGHGHLVCSPWFIEKTNVEQENGRKKPDLHILV
ncbi:unnamed protein product [Pseudo-nitzschia multistriata]|uniref:Alcohol dehydrogenase-like N-terminal domain-containing protein n=1 Tax=Pseudo-nitzschia multistriata TaxID=183589 RepID=A0A448ZQ80_9STRA|nr:unnamed protein product [Pseudo-nitzschia multistriata]